MNARTTINLAFNGASDPVPVHSLRLDRGLAHPVGRAELDLPVGVAAPAPGAVVTIALSQGDTGFTIMTGFVEWRGIGVESTHICVLEKSSKLMRPMADKSYATTTAGQIITDLCSTADVPTQTILPGATIPHIVLRSDRTMLDHAIRLARLSGLLLTSGTDGNLSTLPITLPVPTEPPTLSRAVLWREDSASAREQVANRIIGAGALGSNGPGASTLPLADPSLISSGPNDAPFTDRIAAIRTLADATQARLATLQRRSAAKAGLDVTTPLPEDLSPGDVTLLPDANGLPIRLVRLEALSIVFSAATGLTGRYRFSDLELA